MFNINKFEYSDAPQRSPEWVELRVGKPSASRLKDWLAVGKRDGKPLKARKDYEAELAFEVRFGTPFSRYVTEAMQQGTIMEDHLKRAYEQAKGVMVKPAGCYYNSAFAASPDGLVGEDGLIECKWVYDTTFSSVLTDGIPEEHYLQMQGQLWASGRKWCDYVVGNGNVGRFIVKRVERDEDTISRIRESLKDVQIVETAIKDNELFELPSDSVEAVALDGGF